MPSSPNGTENKMTSDQLFKQWIDEGKPKTFVQWFANYFEIDVEIAMQLLAGFIVAKCSQGIDVGGGDDSI